MTTTSGIVAGVQYAVDNTIIFNVPSSYNYTSGNTFVFTNIVSQGSNPACSLNTSTGVFTCNSTGTYIVHATPYFANMGGTVGITGAVYVNGSLYHTTASFSGVVSFNGSYANVPIITMIDVTTPGTTFTMVITNSATSSLPVQSGTTGSYGYVLYIA